MLLLKHFLVPFILGVFGVFSGKMFLVVESCCFPPVRNEEEIATCSSMVRF